MGSLWVSKKRYAYKRVYCQLNNIYKISMSKKNKAYIGIPTYTVKVHYQEDPKNLNNKHIQAAKCHSLILCEV